MYVPGVLLYFDTCFQINSTFSPRSDQSFVYLTDLLILKIVRAPIVLYYTSRDFLLLSFTPFLSFYLLLFLSFPSFFYFFSPSFIHTIGNCTHELLHRGCTRCSFFRFPPSTFRSLVAMLGRIVIWLINNTCFAALSFDPHDRGAILLCLGALRVRPTMVRHDYVHSV